MPDYNLISWPGPGESYTTEFISNNGGSTLAGTNYWVTRQGGAIQTIVLGGVEYQGTVFWGPNMKMVFAYRVNRGSWTTFIYTGNKGLASIGPPSPADDAHETCVFDFDPDGYVHVAYDHHNEALNYRVSTLPIDDPSFAGVLGSETTINAVLDSVTYPYFFRDPGDNNLFFWCGQGPAAGNRDWYMFKYAHGTTTWAAAPGTSTNGLLINGITDGISAYLNLPCFTSNWDGAGTGYMYASGIWRDSDSTTNNNVFFFRWNGTTFSKTTGSQTVPITRANCEVIDSTSTGNGLSTGSCTGVDANNRPHVAYLRGATNRAIIHYHHTGSAWVENTVVTGSGASAFTQPPDIVIRDSDLAAACVIRRQSDSHLVAYVSDPNDYTTWTVEDLSGAAIEGDDTGTFHDVYQWRTHQKYEMTHPVSATAPMLLDGLVFHFDLGDLYETKTQSASSLLLTNVNTTTFTTGKIGNAPDFTSNSGGSGKQLTLPDNSFTSQTGAMTIACAVNRESTGADRGVLGKWLTTGNQRSFALVYQNSTSRYQWNVSGDGTATTSVLANSFGAGSTAAWEGVIVDHDPTGDVIGISVNAGTRDTTAHSTNIFDSTALFRIAQANSTTATNFMDGLIDELALWSTVLSSTLRTFWYKSGNIRPFNEFGMIAPSIYSHGATATVNCNAGDTPSVTVSAWGNLTMSEALTGTNAASYSVTDNADGTWTITRGSAISAGNETLTLTLTNDAGSDTVDFTFSAASAGPTNTAAPAISLFPYGSETISTDNGTWTGSPTSYSYQWRLANDNAGAGAADITGATSSSLSLTSSYWGKYVRCVVTATNGDGSTSANATLFGATWVYVFAPVARGSITVLTDEWDDFATEDGVDIFNETIGDGTNDLIPFPLTFNTGLASQFRAPWFCVASEFNDVVGRSTDAKAGCGATLISPRHVLMVQHCKPSAVYFKEAGGTEVYREIEWWDWINTDLAVGRLNSTVTTIDPVPILANGNAAVGKTAALLEAGRFLTTLDITACGQNFSVSSSEAESGDSGHPVFIVNGTQPILVGIMSGVGTADVGHSVSANIDRINAILDLYGETLTLVATASAGDNSAVFSPVRSPLNLPLFFSGV